MIMYLLTGFTLGCLNPIIDYGYRQLIDIKGKKLGYMRCGKPRHMQLTSKSIITYMTISTLLLPVSIILTLLEIGSIISICLPDEKLDKMFSKNSHYRKIDVETPSIQFSKSCEVKETTMTDNSDVTIIEKAKDNRNDELSNNYRNKDNVTISIDERLSVDNGEYSKLSSQSVGDNLNQNSTDKHIQKKLRYY